MRANAYLPGSVDRCDGEPDDTEGRPGRSQWGPRSMLHAMRIHTQASSVVLNVTTAMEV